MDRWEVFKENKEIDVNTIKCGLLLCHSHIKLIFSWGWNWIKVKAKDKLTLSWVEGYLNFLSALVILNGWDMVGKSYKGLI